MGEQLRSSKDVLVAVDPGDYGTDTSKGKALLALRHDVISQKTFIFVNHLVSEGPINYYHKSSAVRVYYKA